METKDLLYEQSVLSDEIKKLLINFKKDGSSRKTVDYTKKRLETLEKYWNEYKSNHYKLSELLSREDDYFMGNYFEQAKKNYAEAKQYMENFQSSIKQYSTSAIMPQEKLEVGGSQRFQTSGSEQAPTTSKNVVEENTIQEESSDQARYLVRDSWNKSMLDDKLKKQYSNFRAFARTLSNINIETIQDKWEFEDTLNTLKARWHNIDSLHWEIDSELEGCNEHYEEKFTEHEQKYQEIKKAINTKLWSVSHREKSTPQLDIPIFNGNYQQWVSFKDLFCEAIHNNPTLSSAQKLQFLKSKLKGEAERLIQHLPISSENYQTSWEILNHRYNNKKLIFTTHMNTLMNVPVTQQSNANHFKRLHDVTTECINAIKNLGINIDTWDPILVHILVQKLDTETHGDYLQSLKDPRQLPILSEFLTFLENKFTTMESARRKQEIYQQKSNLPSTSRQDNSYKKYSSNKAVTKSFARIKFQCPVCNNNDHAIYYCQQFQDMSPSQKRHVITKLNFCINCLHEHKGKPCTSTKRCRECNECHNTLLHEPLSRNTMNPNNMTTRSRVVEPNSHVAQQCDAPEVLLATALLSIQGVDGNNHTMRALIDQGSQVSLITEKAAQLLRLPRHKCKGVITGVGTKDNNCNGLITINCNSLTENYSFSTDVYIMKNLTRNLPNETFAKPTWKFLKNINLADPNFNQSKPVDILFGAEIYSNIIKNGIYKHNNMTPIAQQTRLGWILCGKIQTLQCNIVLNNTEELVRFWEIEDIPENNKYSKEESDCIEFYKSTTTRLDDGKYQVRLPIKSSIDQLGNSKPTAIAQFRQLERKFSKNIQIKTEYSKFIQEYQDLHHMKPAERKETQEFFLPHHCVLRADSSTTSLRVVFNASQVTSTGTSLNDVMHAGPNLQQDLFSLILKWRQYKVAFTADIEKMFRQIWVQEDDQAFQKIVWRNKPQDLLREYQLTTVTYGTKAAPYLAMMTLRQLASDERQNYPEAAKIVENCFYMDDLLHGSHSLQSAAQLKQDLINIMKAGGFNLRKWNSNYQELVQSQKENNKNDFNFNITESTKTLGLIWNPEKDVFKFQPKLSNKAIENTKRSLLSEISQLFDPLGWLTPLSTKMKLIFQQVWKTNMAWDNKLPELINQEWNDIKNDISNIESIQIPRWLNSNSTCKVELHGFCDASQKAYACVVYSKIMNSGQAEIKLLAGKSRLVPCKKEVSLPRLELSGALLLSKLMEKIKQNLPEIDEVEVFGWIDSTAVLGWLQGNPNRWKPFVSNRVHKIVEIMPSECWQYVKSSENPADCASRGVKASQLQQHPLWWQGPTWLATYDDTKQEHPIYKTKEEEKQQKQVHVVQTQNSNLIKDMIYKYSSFSKLVRVLAWVRRFATKKENKQVTSWLTLSEIRDARKRIIKQVQEEVFDEEISCLKQKRPISTKSKLNNLNPFIDDDEILRVGGRLKNACINMEMKHPIILPQNHHLTELIINNAHELTFHGGARVTLAFARQKYWILSGNRTAKKYIHKCVTCRKQKPNLQAQIMGDLPVSRVNPSRPFKNTGVDFTGHVFLKANKGRGIKTTKGYIAVFICMVTKAVHVELVSDLTSSAFIAALRRMAARRGTPSDIYCDNGRNFVGANRVIQQEYEEIFKTFDDELHQELTNMEIKFHWNVAFWPSAGGIWESSIKSLKFHIKRVIGEQRLTFEEFSTLLAQFEACLNSRPLCALTEDPEDLNYLTPSHFLSSGPVLTIIETERDMRTRWNLTQTILRDVWKRWRAEYLSQLTTRSKWRNPSDNMKLGDIVIVHEENLPPGKWIMGRVIELHPGKDGYVRVVTLKTKSGYMKRPIVKLSPLISQEDAPSTHSNHTTIQQETANKAPQPKKPKTSFFASLLTTFLLFMTILSSSEANVTVSKFRENQGFYFDKVSNMQLIKDEWKLVVYYNMEPYWLGDNALKTYIQSLETTCITIREQAHHCDAIILQLRHGYNDLQYYNTLLLNQQFHDKPARQRVARGLVNGVGYLANTLFGVLDARFADQYKQDIEHIQQNQNHIMALWKNQTSITEAENNLLKRTESVMNQQFKTINQHMISLEKFVIDLNNVGQMNYIANEFAIGAIIASNMLNNLKFLQDTLLDTVTDIYQGSFNLHLLTPEQLIDELNVISNKLPKEVLLPINNIHSNIYKFYKLIKIKARMLQDVLIFEMKIPLISRETYELLKITAIPKVHKGEIIKLSAVSDYIAMNIKKDTYIPFTELDTKACLEQEDNMFCHSQQPEYHLNNGDNLCVTLKQECATRTSSCKNTWQDTYNPNVYLYLCCDDCQATAICGDQMTRHQLIGVGLVNMGYGCFIKTDELTIYPHKPHSSEFRIAPYLYTPKYSPINNIINITVPHMMTINVSQQEFDHQSADIAIQLRKLKENEALPSEVSYHDVHHYTMIYFLLGVITVISIILIARCIQQRKRKQSKDATRSPPVPAPRPAEDARLPRPHDTHNAPGTSYGISRTPPRLLNKSTSPILRKFNEMFIDESV